VSDAEMSSEGQNFGELYGGLLLDELGRQGVPWAEESRQNLDQWVMSHEYKSNHSWLCITVVGTQPVLGQGISWRSTSNLSQR